MSSSALPFFVAFFVIIFGRGNSNDFGMEFLTTLEFFDSIWWSELRCEMNACGNESVWINNINSNCISFRLITIYMQIVHTENGKFAQHKNVIRMLTVECQTSTADIWRKEHTGTRMDKEMKAEKGFFEKKNKFS